MATFAILNVMFRLDLDEAQRAVLLERAIRVLADDRSEDPLVSIIFIIYFI